MLGFRCDCSSQCGSATRDCYSPCCGLLAANSLPPPTHTHTHTPTRTRTRLHAHTPTVNVWEFKWPRNTGFHVHGELILGVPNDGSAALLNVVGGAIVMFDRGAVRVSTRALRSGRCACFRYRVGAFAPVPWALFAWQLVHVRVGILCDPRVFQVPFAEKVRHAQDAGAAAVVVVDTSGECSPDFQCGRLLGSKAERLYLGDIDDQVPPALAVPISG